MNGIAPAPTVVAIVGSGFMARTHLAAYQQLPDVRICGSVSRSGTTIVDDVPAFGSIESLLAVDRPDVVSVCTPTSTHVDIVEQLLHAGIDVICEKPLALDPSSALALLDLAERLGRRLDVAHVVRFMEPYRAIADLISSGRLGDIGTVRVRRAVPPPSGVGEWFLDPEQSGGVALDLMVHDVDFLVGCFGVPVAVFAQRSRIDRTETVIASFRFADGVIAMAEASWGGVTELDTGCEVAGSLGNASFASTPRAPLLVIDSREPSRATVSMPLPTVASMDPYLLQLGHHLALRQTGRVDHAGLSQTRGTVRAAALVMESLESGAEARTDVPGIGDVR